MTTDISLHQFPLYVFKIEPHPISGLRLAFVGVMQVALIWKSENGTVTCQILLESIRSCEELTQDLTANISDLKPGIQHNITLYLLESYENHRDPLATESGLGELQKYALLFFSVT